ncbi:hypothetical protein ACWC10_37155 [Streptomyces sp. NPDC001595]|uniref:hypothetical protein n=1 Tax=Streptomyces sp. NPDC001532 TaxID=3154520 RepID=UPI0033332071
MSIIVKFFVAPDDTSAGLALQPGPGRAFESLSIGNFDPEEAVVEWECLQPRIVAGQSDDGCVVFAISPRLPTALADAGHSRSSDVAASWTRLCAEDGEVIDTWESFPDVNSMEPKEGEAAPDYMPDALGHALEAATLGYRPGTRIPVWLPQHPGAAPGRRPPRAARSRRTFANRCCWATGWATTGRNGRATAWRRAEVGGRGHVRMRIVISRRSVRVGLLATAVTGLLGLAATGCDGDGNEEPADKALAGTQVCGGDAVSAQASKALKVITGTSRFGTTAEKSTVAQAANNLVAVFPAATGGRDDVCRIYTAGGEADFASESPGGCTATLRRAPDPEFTVLNMGERTLAAANRASVRFACRSDKLPNSMNEAAHVGIGVERWGTPTEPEGDTEALKNAYATVAHSFSLAMAKELGCEKNGGLPEKLITTP